MLIGLRRLILRGMRPWEKKGQVTTVAILIIAVVFLLLMITLNIRQVAARKTSTAIAADGAAITVASLCGSYAHMLSEKELDGKDKKSKLAWGGFVTIAILIFAFALGGPVGVALAASTIIAAGSYYCVIQPGQVDGINRLLAEAPLKVGLHERGIMYAFQRTVDDPVMVVDEHDFDEDGDTTNKISRFWKWYQFRVIRIAEKYEKDVITKDQLKKRTDDIKNFTEGYVKEDFLPLLADLEDGVDSVPPLPSGPVTPPPDPMPDECPWLPNNNPGGGAYQWRAGMGNNTDEAWARWWRDPGWGGHIIWHPYWGWQDYPTIVGLWEANPDIGWQEFMNWQLSQQLNGGSWELFFPERTAGGGGFNVDISFWGPGPTGEQIAEWRAAAECEGYDPIEPPEGWDQVDELIWMVYSSDYPEDYTFCRWVDEVDRLGTHLILLIHEWAPQLIDDDDDSWDNIWAAQEERIGEWTEESVILAPHWKLGWNQPHELEGLKGLKEELEARALDAEHVAEMFADGSDAKTALLANAEEYRDLADRVDEAIEQLDSFKEGEIAGLQGDIDDIKTVIHRDQLLAPSRTTAIYTWEDSLGKHTVIVVVDGRLPYLKTSKGFFKITQTLIRKSGDIIVEVTRTDRPIEKDGVVYGAMELNLPGKPALWEDPMREDSGKRKIASKATAHYNYKSDKCTLVSAE